MSPKPVFKTGEIRLATENPCWIKQDADIQDVHFASNIPYLVFSHSTDKIAKAWPVAIELTDLVDKWYTDELGPARDLLVIISDDKPYYLNIDLVKAVPTAEILWKEPSKDEPEKIKEPISDKSASDKVSEKLFYVSASSLNVRANPSASAKKIGSLSKGDEVRLVGLEDIPPGSPFVKVLYADKSKASTGYVSSQYLSTTVQQSSSLATSAKKAPAKSSVKNSDLITPVDTGIDKTTILKWSAIGLTIAALITIAYSMRKKKVA